MSQTTCPLTTFLSFTRDYNQGLKINSLTFLHHYTEVSLILSNLNHHHLANINLRRTTQHNLHNSLLMPFQVMILQLFLEVPRPCLGHLYNNNPSFFLTSKPPLKTAISYLLKPHSPVLYSTPFLLLFRGNTTTYQHWIKDDPPTMQKKLCSVFKEKCTTNHT